MKKNMQKIESITNSDDMKIVSQFFEFFVISTTLILSNSNESDLSKRAKWLNKRAKKERKKSTNKKNAIDNDNDDIEYSVPKCSKNKNFEKTLIEVQFMKSQNIAAQLKVDQAEFLKRFEAEMKQKNQQHEQLIFQHKKLMLK